MKVWISREKRETRIDLSEDTAYSPQIDTLIVKRISNKKLRRSIPTSRYIVSVLVILFLSCTARETEIAKFDNTIFTKQQIFRLDISVHYFIWMQKVKCSKDLVYDGFNLIWS